MPKTAREVLKRKLEQSTNLCDNIGGHLFTVMEMSAPVKPDIAATVEKILEMQQLVQKSIIQLNETI